MHAWKQEIMIRNECAMMEWGVYPASIYATLQDVFFIMLDVGGSVNADIPTASTFTIGPSNNELAIRVFWSGESVSAHRLFNLVGAASRCVWRAMHPDTLSALGLKKTGC